MASTRNARCLVPFHRWKQVWIGSVYRTFFKRACSGVTVQALAVVVGLIELDVLRRRRCSKVIDVDMSQPAKLSLASTKHVVIREACVVGCVLRNSMFL